MKQPVELRPCIFCDKNGTVLIRNHRLVDLSDIDNDTNAIEYFVSCTFCGARGNPLENPMDAINQWNRIYRHVSVYGKEVE